LTDDLPTPRTGGEILVDALRLHGVEDTFCVPGESYLAALDAMYGARNQIRVITCRQEGGASFMAEAYGKMTGKPGICFVTRGPGACNAAIGVHTAMQDSTPMILFVGQVAREAMGREGFQEIDYRQMFAPPITKLAMQIDDPARIPELVHHAFRTATSGRQGPVVIALPEDMLTETASVLDGNPYQPTRAHPGPGQMAEIRAALEAAERPLMILGGTGWTGAAGTAIAEFARANGLPVVVSFRRQDLFDNADPHYVGDLSTSVDPKLVKRVQDSDLLLVSGARLGEMTTRGYTTIDTPAPRQKLIHVYPDAEELGRVFQPHLAVVAGMEEFATAASALEPVDGGRWADWLASGRADYEATKLPDALPGPVDMHAVMAALVDALPEDTIITIDAGNFSGWPQRFWQFRTHPSELAPTDGAMGYSIPAGVAAKVAAPERAVVSFVGDGGFLMTGQEFATALHHGLTPIVIVVNNGTYGTIRMHQERDYPDRPIATELTNPDFAALARAYGGHGETVERTEDFAPALDRALASGTAAIIEIRLDVEVITTRGTLSAIRDRALARAAE
jgi:acetolactate synthase-1/2/3 large subunit